MQEVIDRVQQRGRDAVVVFGRDEHERVDRRDRGAPRLLLLALVLLKSWVGPLREDRKVDDLEIQQFDIEPLVLARALDKPLRDRQTDTSLANTANHDTELRHAAEYTERRGRASGRQPSAAGPLPTLSTEGLAFWWARGRGG